MTRAFVVERVHAAVTNWNIAPVLGGSLVLAVIDRRYITGVVLLAPWFLVHVLSVRPEHGHFLLYYALPSLLPVLMWLAVLARRMRASSVSAAERAVLVVLALALSAPVQAIVGTRQQRWDVARQGVTRPVVDIAAMKELVRRVHANVASSAAERNQKQCASMGIAALVPDDFAPDDPGRDVSACRTVFLLRHDMHYGALSAKAQSSGFRRVAARENAELWMSDRQ